MNLINDLTDKFWAWNHNIKVSNKAHVVLGSLDIPLEGNLCVFSRPDKAIFIQDSLKSNVGFLAEKGRGCRLSSNLGLLSGIDFMGEATAFCPEDLRRYCDFLALSRARKVSMISWVTFLCEAECSDHLLWQKYFANHRTFLFDSSARVDHKSVEVWRAITKTYDKVYSLRQNQFLLYVSGTSRILLGEF
jgi:hypothetical protein